LAEGSSRKGAPSGPAIRCGFSIGPASTR
jgi:hypothetical protein